MQRIVINGCYGGFSLSAKGVAAYLERKGVTGYFYIQEKSTDLDSDYLCVPAEEADSGAFGMFEVLTEDAGERLTKDEMWPDGKYHPARAVYHRDIPRDDPDLVAVAEADSAGASGRCAELRVVDVPDGVGWWIEEYDGVEWVAEEHRTWN